MFYRQTKDSPVIIILLQRGEQKIENSPHHPLVETYLGMLTILQSYGTIFLPI